MQTMAQDIQGAFGTMESRAGATAIEHVQLWGIIVFATSSQVI
jgi:hypothetical protein